MTADGGRADLWASVLVTTPMGERTIRIPARGGPHRRKERQAKVTLRCREVSILPPQAFDADEPLPMIAVSALEETPRTPKLNRGKMQSVDPPLHWVLLLSKGTADLDTALTALHWYELRWRIARFFHTLKQGTHIEQRHLNEAEDLRKCLAFDSITAFRVWDLALLAQTKPDALAQNYVCPEDISVLLVRAHDPHDANARDPPTITVSQFVVLVAGLVGFHPSKRQPLPGTQKLWEGIRILNESIATVRAYQAFGATRSQLK